MGRRAGAWLPWAVFGMAWVMAVSTFELSRRNGSGPSSVSLILVQMLFVALGALVASRRPGNTMGWIFVAIGVIGIAGPLSEQYAEYAYVTNPGSLPAPWVALWFGEWYWIVWLYLTFVFTALLFPSGHLPSPRWRPAFKLICAAVAGLAVMAGLERELALPNSDFTIENPIGLLPLDDIEEGWMGGPLVLVSIASILTALAALVVRFARSTGEERQQLKWFTFAGSLLIVGFIVNGFLDATGVGRLEIGDLVLFSLVPIAVGMSILRYRLYDIDRIISRTVAYGLLSALLAGGYLLAVLTLQSFLPVADDSPLIVAMSTLAVVAAFGPLHLRIQRVVDRRFNRSRYDSALTIESFGADLRREVDLDSLSHQLVRVVDRTMHPTHISLWLRTKQENQ
ncbi:MAG: hypothetical protein ACRDK3_02080 [Actinomycetota bacterium]